MKIVEGEKVARFRICNKLVGEGKPCFIIAEAGVNHNGDINLAKKLIDVAIDAGVDAVKFQTFRAEDVVVEKTPMANYQMKNIGIEKSQLEMLQQYELTYTDFKELKDYCDEKNIIFLSTPHSEDAADFLEPLVPVYKIGSGDLTNIPFLEKVAVKGKPMIIGTGMATLDEVKEALATIYQLKDEQVILLHSTTSYPCSLNEVNIKAMQSMRKDLNCLVGYSDHTLGLTVPLMAVTMGAVVIEKHFTLDKTMSGPDHKASLEPDELKAMVRSIKEVEKAMGEGVKRPTKSEEKIMQLIRKSIVAKKDLPTGTKMTREIVTSKRPGTGLSPKYLNKIVGRRLKKSVKKDEQINLSELE